MPRVNHVKRARKDNPVCKKGESYYWWQFAFSSKSFSLTRPRPSQLTRSAYYSPLCAAQEQVEDATCDSVDSLTECRDGAVSTLEEMRDEQEEKIQNMSEHGLEYTPSGEMIQERYDALEEAISELENIDCDLEDYDEDSEEDEESFQEAFSTTKDEIIEAIGNAHV
jgi:hypothetical protein